VRGNRSGRIDRSVIVAVERDLAEIGRLGLTLAYTLDTHIHADTSLRAGTEEQAEAKSPHRHATGCVRGPGIEEGTPLTVGGIVIHPLHTRGTPTGISPICPPTGYYR